MRDVARSLVAALVLSGTSIPLAAGQTCNLTTSQEMRAVKAFKALSPIFYDQRCLNCHGAVNPFAANGDHPEVIDMKEAARKFLEQPDARARIIARNEGAKTPGLESIRAIAEGNGPFTDKDLIRANAFEPMRQECARCHVDDWLIPMSHNDFVGRSWKQICMHIKSSELTNTPVTFLRHMQSDSQVKLGLEGKRGLLSPVGAEPPAMSADTVARHANDWVDAMGGKFHQPAECGCELNGLALEIRHRVYTNPGSAASRMGSTQFDGTVVFNVLLKELAEGKYYNDEIAVRRELEVKYPKPAFWQCAGTAWRDELWQISADIDEQKQSMIVRFGFVEQAEDASWTCKAKGQTVTDTLNVNVYSFLRDLTMPTTEGAVGRRDGQLPEGFTDTRYIRQFESIAVSIIDRSSPQQ